MDDERSGYPGAPPGWYPDPAGGPGQRWWDGYAWTETVVLPEAPPAPGTMPGAFGPPPGPAQFPPGFPAGQFGHGDARLLAADEFRLSRPARVAVAVPAVYLLVNLISLRANAAAYRTYGHQLHLNMQAVQNNQPQAPLTVPNQFTGSLNGLASVVALCTLLAVVLACVWQFRAASTARALGYPARRRPGWGVAFWFIPIVNYWMPYQAIRDTLPPGHVHRPLVLRWWLVLIAAQTLSGLATLAALFSTSTALVFSLGAGVCCVFVLMLAPRLVTAVTAAHHAALS